MERQNSNGLIKNFKRECQSENVSKALRITYVIGCDNTNTMHARMRDLDSQFDEVTINGKKQEISGITISYDQVVNIAFPNSKNVDFSIIIEASKENWKEAQILKPNSTVEKFNGMKIKCYYTGNS